MSLEQIVSDQIQQWPEPTMLDSVAGRIRIVNLTSDPQTVKRNDHLGIVRPTFTPDSPSDSIVTKATRSTKMSAPTNFSQNVRIDPDNILPDRITTDLNAET